MNTIKRTTLTAKEAAEYLGISYWLLLDMAKRNEVPHIRAGQRILFRLTSVNEWMDVQEELSIKKVNPADSYGSLRRIEVD